MPKRDNYIDWDTMFIGIAAMAAFRSKDPNTQNGACIVNAETKRVMSVGYNGMPAGCSDDEFPWERKAKNSHEAKYDYVIHAERNAIDNYHGDMEGAILYLYSERGYLPCSFCAQGIVQHGISEVVLAFIDEDCEERYNSPATKKMFEARGVEVRTLMPSRNDCALVFHGLSSRLTGIGMTIDGEDVPSTHSELIVENRVLGEEVSKMKGLVDRLSLT